jgi:hypothetical protein
MRPKLVMIILFITLAFFLILMISSGIRDLKSVDRVLVVRYHNPTPENIRELELERHKARRDQHVACGLVALNIIVIIVYGALQNRKPVA